MKFSVRTVDTGQMYYDLLGRPVGTQPAAPGIYVSRGKKMIITTNP